MDEAPVAAGGRRSRLRAQTIDDIKTVGRQLIAANGAAALSMREIGRALSMAPSALYRYFDGRDALLAALIVDAYDALADALAAAIAAVPPDRPLDRWLAACRALRRWAFDDPSRWGLLYGTPVPGYAGDEVTRASARRVTSALTGILADAARLDLVDQDRLAASTATFDAAVLAAAGVAAAQTRVPPALLAEGIEAWASLIGLVSFDVFGHLTGLFADATPLFDHHVAALGASLSLVAPV